MINLGVLRWEIFLHYPGSPSIITRFLIRLKQENQRQRRRCDAGSRGQRDRKGMAVSKEYRQPPRGKTRETEPPLELLEGMQPLNFGTS